LIAIIDSFAWIEFLLGSPNEPRVREVVGTAELVITPDIVLAELARKLMRDGVAQRLVQRKLEDIGTLSHVVAVDGPVAIGVFAADQELQKNAKASRLGRPGLADALILSSARVFGGRVLTGDPHFRGLHETDWLGT
jgi:predicted nucleic acid-binding protein